MLSPFIGERVHGPLGKGINIIAVVGTMFGVATSIGLGTLQVSRGLEHLFGVDGGLIDDKYLILIGFYCFRA